MEGFCTEEAVDKTLLAIFRA